MKKEDWSVPAIVFEAVDILTLLAYLILQIVYAVLYHISAVKVVVNLLAVILVYAGLTLLALYPETVNRLPAEACRGRIRVFSLRMIRTEKCLFLLSLLLPCVCDVAAYALPPLYNVCVILWMIAVAVFYEVRIILEFRKKE